MLNRDETTESILASCPTGTCGQRQRGIHTEHRCCSRVELQKEKPAEKAEIIADVSPQARHSRHGINALLLLVEAPSSTPPAQSVRLGVGLSERGCSLRGRSSVRVAKRSVSDDQINQ